MTLTPSRRAELRALANIATPDVPRDVLLALLDLADERDMFVACHAARLDGMRARLDGETRPPSEDGLVAQARVLGWQEQDLELAFRSEVVELRATLAAERGDPAGALPGWKSTARDNGMRRAMTGPKLLAALREARALMAGQILTESGGIPGSDIGEAYEWVCDAIALAEREATPPVVEPVDEEALGRLVRETWVAWAHEQPDLNEHPGWLMEWDNLAERHREVDRRIVRAVLARIQGAAPAELPPEDARAVVAVLEAWERDSNEASVASHTLVCDALHDLSGRRVLFERLATPAKGEEDDRG